MPNEIEGVAPDSLEAQAIAELQKEGHEIEESQPASDNAKIEEPKVEVKEPEAPAKKEEAPEKPDRTPSMVEAWKLKVAEDQKDSLTQKVSDLETKLNELSKQTRPVTENQKEDIADDIKKIAEDSGVDADFLGKFADTILKKAEARFKPSEDINKVLQSLTEEREAAKQENLYNKEFLTDIEPLVREQYGLSDTALSQLKTQLKDLAFSETYAKVPLAKILKAEFDTLGIKETKKSSEGKAVKIRSNEVVDYNNLTEEQFVAMSAEQVAEFEKRNSGSWSIPR